MMIYAGIVLILAGLTLRLVAMRTLGQAWSLDLKKPPFIVTTGIYRYIRHPAYIGTVLMVLGMSVIYPPLAITYLAVIFFLARIIEEEKYLKRKK